MSTTSGNLAQLTCSSKRFARWLLATGENRLELFMVEVQEERERLVRALFLVMGAAIFALLTGFALTITVVLVLWDHSPVIALLVLTGLYAGSAALLYGRLGCLRRDWQTLPATLDQLKKDRVCLEQSLN